MRKLSQNYLIIIIQECINDDLDLIKNHSINLQITNRAILCAPFLINKLILCQLN